MPPDSDMIPFLDLKAQYSDVKAEVESAVLRTMASTQYVLGRELSAFEEQFADYCGVRHCVGVNSGTSALHLALLAAGVGQGDEVITVSMTFVATTAAILYAGAVPVFVDVHPTTWTMDPNKIETAITPRTRAILPVHLHGLVAQMDPINEIANKHGLVVIEDAAQAHGGERVGRRAGSMGRIGCFSFYPAKNLGAFGEAGAAVTDDDELARQMRLLRNWGEEKKYRSVVRGYNYRMDEIQAAVLGVKLGHVERWTEARRRHAARYEAALSRLGIGRPMPPDDRSHVYHVYSVVVPGRDTVQSALSAEGIATGIHYPVPVHLQKAYADLCADADLPVTEALARGFLSLPIFSELRTDQIDKVAGALERALKIPQRIVAEG